MEMDYVLARYGELGVKSSPVRERMINRLRQRIVNRLDYDSLDHGDVRVVQGRIVFAAEDATEAARAVSSVPGVSSASPAVKTASSIEAMKEAAETFDYGESFGVDTSRAGDHSFTSRDVSEELGARIEEFSGADVDLENPDTWLGVEVRFDDAFLFTDSFGGPDGYPVGSQEPLMALVSGGIDSPVAAHQVMTRGSPVLPVYFYNEPVAAEDHWLRFQAAVEKLERFHPSKDWECYRVDMGQVNDTLMGVGRGRMVLHRIVMFRAAEELARQEGLKGLVTGESLGQKSSQTVSNLEMTSSEVEMPVHRPLLSWSKNEITDKAREIGTFEEAQIASACSTLAPDSPATSLKQEKLESLKREAGIDSLVEKAVAEARKLSI